MRNQHSVLGIATQKQGSRIRAGNCKDAEKLGSVYCLPEPPKLQKLVCGKASDSDEAAWRQEIKRGQRLRQLTARGFTALRR